MSVGWRPLPDHGDIVDDMYMEVLGYFVLWWMSASVCQMSHTQTIRDVIMSMLTLTFITL